MRLVVPFTPGGSTDILARAMGQRLGEIFNQPFIIDNRPGAGGTLGSEQVFRAAPDGQTLMMGHIGTLAGQPRAVSQPDLRHRRASCRSRWWRMSRISWW